MVHSIRRRGNEEAREFSNVCVGGDVCEFADHRPGYRGTPGDGVCDRSVVAQLATFSLSYIRAGDGRELTLLNQGGCKMDKTSIAWSAISATECCVRVAQDEHKKAQYALIEIKKDEALVNLEKYPQHAKTVLDELLVVVVNILR